MKNIKAKQLLNQNLKGVVSLNSKGERLCLFLYSQRQMQMKYNTANFNDDNRDFLLNPHQVVTPKGTAPFSEKSFNLNFKSNFTDSQIVSITTIDNIVK